MILEFFRHPQVQKTGDESIHFLFFLGTPLNIYVCVEIKKQHNETPLVFKVGYTCQCSRMNHQWAGVSGGARIPSGRHNLPPLSTQLAARRSLRYS